MLEKSQNSLCLYHISSSFTKTEILCFRVRYHKKSAGWCFLMRYMSCLYWSLFSFYLVRRTWSCQWLHCGGIWDWRGHTYQVSRHQLLEHHRGPRPPAPPLSSPWALHTKTQGSEGFTPGPESDPRPRPPSLLPRILAKWVPDGLWPSAAWDDLHGVRQFAGHPETQHHQEAHPAEAPRLPAVECRWQGGHPIRVGEPPEFGRSGVIQLCCWTFTSGGRGAAGLEATCSWWVCEKLSKFHTWWEYEPLSPCCDDLVMMCLVYVFTTYCRYTQKCTSEMFLLKTNIVIKIISKWAFFLNKCTPEISRNLWMLNTGWGLNFFIYLFVMLIEIFRCNNTWQQLHSDRR